MAEEKRPEFVISSRFEFERFSRKPQFSLALSLFTHLAADDIRLCLGRLRDFVPADHRLFATFFEGNSARNKSRSDSLDHFEYGREELIALAAPERWQASYIGDWDHPRDQMMMMFGAV